MPTSPQSPAFRRYTNEDMARWRGHGYTFDQIMDLEQGQVAAPTEGETAEQVKVRVEGGPSADQGSIAGILGGLAARVGLPIAATLAAGPFAGIATAFGGSLLGQSLERPQTPIDWGETAFDTAVGGGPLAALKIPGVATRLAMQTPKRITQLSSLYGAGVGGGHEAFSRLRTEGRLPTAGEWLPPAVAGGLFGFGMGKLGERFGRFPVPSKPVPAPTPAGTLPPVADPIDEIVEHIHEGLLRGASEGARRSARTILKEVIENNPPLAAAIQERLTVKLNLPAFRLPPPETPPVEISPMGRLADAMTESMIGGVKEGVGRGAMLKDPAFARTLRESVQGRFGVSPIADPMEEIVGGIVSGMEGGVGRGAAIARLMRDKALKPEIRSAVLERLGISPGAFSEPVAPLAVPETILPAAPTLSPVTSMPLKSALLPKPKPGSKKATVIRRAAKKR